MNKIVNNLVGKIIVFGFWMLGCFCIGDKVEASEVRRIEWARQPQVDIYLSDEEEHKADETGVENYEIFGPIYYAQGGTLLMRMLQSKFGIRMVLSKKKRWKTSGFQDWIKAKKDIRLLQLHMRVRN